MTYRHTQRGSIIIASVGLAFLVALYAFWGTDQPGTLRMGIPAALLVALFLFSSLTVEISGSALTCSFGPGLIRRTFLLSEIRGAKVVRNHWYSGWGIRWRPGQYVMWNVSGLGAVELTLSDGSAFRVGSDEPQALLDAIRNYRSIAG